jgi:hypothetical protein
MPDAWDRFRPRHGAWWIPDESPGGLGEEEVWIDESAMDMYGRGDAEPAVSVRPASEGAGTWLGASIRFSRHPGLAEPVIYAVALRRCGPGLVNLGRPYYVLRRPD